MKLAVIVDGDAVQRFALDALDAVSGTDEITVFSCTNTRFERRWVQHGAYYALNLLTVRNRFSRYVPIANGKKRIAGSVAFESDYDGAWQVLPPNVIDHLHSFDIVLKFGMGLLRVPSEDALPVPILSYHHGDPDRYRGRPAGFWEITDGTPVMGQVVQVIGNRLDAGKVVASAETKVFPWSYRRTLMEAYGHSPLIIDMAIRNAISGTYLPKAGSGRNCSLPANKTVLGFVVRAARNAIGRLAYGAFREKSWRVSTARCPALVPAFNLPSAAHWQTIPIASGYRFYADPFFSSEPRAILVEALNDRSGLGEIVRIDEVGHRPLIRERGHLSYPATANINGREIIVPECASWSRPRVYLANGGFLSTIRIAADPRVSDLTLIEHDGVTYIFGNDRRLGSNILNLWLAASLDDEFRPHPASPIRISPAGSRMGGNIIRREGRLFRLGQDFSRDYGDGLIVFEINELTPEAYSETRTGEIRFEDRKGPHTLNVRSDEIVFDWYRDDFSPLAGFRRLKGLLQLRRPQATQ